jgi:hypothetical protein
MYRELELFTWDGAFVASARDKMGQTLERMQIRHAELLLVIVFCSLALVALKQRADGTEKQYVLRQQGKVCFLALSRA